jgi:hypothetical protein
LKMNIGSAFTLSIPATNSSTRSRKGGLVD